MYKTVVGFLVLLGFRNLYSNTQYFLEAWSSLVSQGISYKYLVLSMTVGGGFAWVSLALVTCFFGLILIRKEDTTMRLILKTLWGGLISYMIPPIILLGWFSFTVWLHRFF